MFDVCTNNLGESGEEVGTRSRELIATNEPAVITKAALDPIVVEDSKGDGGFPNPPAPMRATGSRFSAKPATSSISSLRPKQALGGGGGDSPRGRLRKCKAGDFQHSQTPTWLES